MFNQFNKPQHTSEDDGGRLWSAEPTRRGPALRVIARKVTGGRVVAVLHLDDGRPERRVGRPAIAADGLAILRDATRSKKAYRH